MVDKLDTRQGMDETIDLSVTKEYDATLISVDVGECLESVRATVMHLTVMG